MHAPVQHEQTYTPPDATDAIGETAADGNDTIDNVDAHDIGKQTIIYQAQPTTTGAR
ncbi:MAG: hypothetical protein I3J03_10070 [Actinomyces succiniciruminis]|nr:hypothetical protein [Actinomyces succiniciruminis]